MWLLGWPLWKEFKGCPVQDTAGSSQLCNGPTTWQSRAIWRRFYCLFENIFRKVCKNMEEERTEGARRSEMQEVFHGTAVTAWKGLWPVDEPIAEQVHNWNEWIWLKWLQPVKDCAGAQENHRNISLTLLRSSSTSSTLTFSEVLWAFLTSSISLTS